MMDASSDERPEYIHCVRFNVGVHHKEFERGSWCGGDHELQPFFQDIDHAALHRRQHGRLLVCPECRDAIIKALTDG